MMNLDLLVPIISICVLVFIVAMNIIHISITLDVSIGTHCSNCLRHSSDTFKIRLRDHASVKIILFLSHLSMILMLTVPTLILLTYYYPLSERVCIIYWKTLTILYAFGLYCMKFIYQIRAYTVFYTISPQHIACKFIKGLFIAECCLFVFVSITMDLWLYGDKINNDINGIPCILNLELKAAYIPLILMFIDAALLTLFTIKLLKITKNRSSANVQSVVTPNINNNISEMKIAIIYHFTLTLICVLCCGLDYLLNVIYMDSYLKLIAIAIDSLLIVTCNFFIVNDKIEQISLKFLHSKFGKNVGGDLSNQSNLIRPYQQDSRNDHSKSF